MGADFEAGRAVVVGGEQSSVTPCFTCHGLDGTGDSAGAFPRLTGQAAFYMYKQLIGYASGERPNDVMSPIARQMTDAQMADVAFYYALSKAPYPPPPAYDTTLIALGRKIAEDGLREADVDACNICHGRNGTGDPALFPYLAGQYAPYTELQLRLWKEGTRHNDPLGVMQTIAEAMTLEQIRAVAVYYGSLPPPAGGAEDALRVSERQSGK
jgi:cytochrome c553